MNVPLPQILFLTDVGVVLGFDANIPSAMLVPHLIAPPLSQPLPPPKIGTAEQRTILRRRASTDLPRAYWHVY